MKRKIRQSLKSIFKVLGIIICYIPALIGLCLCIVSIVTGITEEWVTKPEYINYLSGTLMLYIIYLGIPFIITIISLWYAIAKKTLWARILKYIYICNIVVFTLLFIFAPNNELTTAQDMENNYITHKNDMEALIRYVNSTEKPGTKVEYDRKEMSSTDNKKIQTIMKMMEKANIYKIEMETVNTDSSQIICKLTYKYYPLRYSGTDYRYNIRLNTNKDYDSIKYMPIGIRYNDSVWFSDYQALLGGNHFPDRDEYIKKLNKKK